MLRQLNDKRQVTIPAPIARRLGVSGRSWVDVSEKGGVVAIIPVPIEAQQAEPLNFSDKDWKAFNRKVKQELAEGKGKTFPDAASFLKDLRRRIRA